MGAGGCKLVVPQGLTGHQPAGCVWLFLHRLFVFCFVLWWLLGFLPPPSLIKPGFILTCKLYCFCPADSLPHPAWGGGSEQVTGLGAYVPAGVNPLDSVFWFPCVDLEWHWGGNTWLLQRGISGGEIFWSCTCPTNHVFINISRNHDIIKHCCAPATCVNLTFLCLISPY